MVRFNLNVLGPRLPLLQLHQVLVVVVLLAGRTGANLGCDGLVIAGVVAGRVLLLLLLRAADVTGGALARHNCSSAASSTGACACSTYILR